MLQYKDWKNCDINMRKYYNDTVEGFLDFLRYTYREQSQNSNLYYLTEKGHLHKITNKKIKILKKTNYYNFYLLNEEDYNNIKNMSKDALQLYYELEVNFD